MCTQKINILDLGISDLREKLINLGFKKYAADQLFLWIYQASLFDPEQWTNISRKNRQIIKDNFSLLLPDIEKREKDSSGTVKVLLRLEDKSAVEAVLIKEKAHYTFCISSQVGCKQGCLFCATAGLGFKRDLTSGEILSQIIILKQLIPDYSGKLNIVLMGMGEPLNNYRNLKRALEIMTDPKGMLISPRNITLSTSGVSDKLAEFEKDFPRIKVSISLNASSQEMRERLMPFSVKYRLRDLLMYLRTSERKYRVTFEYVLISGVNDSLKDAAEVCSLVKGISCKFNLIPYNENPDIDFKTPDTETIKAFEDFLVSRNHTVITRWSKGRDIKSACGQLAGS